MSQPFPLLINSICYFNSCMSNASIHKLTQKKTQWLLALSTFVIILDKRYYCECITIIANICSIALTTEL